MSEEQGETVEEQLARWNPPPDEDAEEATDEEADEEDEEADSGGSYDGMVKADLRAEIDERNADRSDEDMIVPDSDRKADLIAALEADDMG